MPDLTPAQADRLAAIEAADDAPESLRMRLADAFFWADDAMSFPCSDEDLAHCLRLADAALRVVTKGARS